METNLKTRAVKDVERMAGHTRYGLLTGVLVIAPWLFGGWEMWWFSLLLIPIAIVALLGGLSIAVRAPALDGTALLRPPHAVWVSAIPFLLYAGIRTLQAPVPMDAWKMYLLHISAWTVGLSVAFGITKSQQRRLWLLLMLNLAAMAIYAFVNHALTGSRKVLWADGYEQYYRLGRMGGTYFCPSHFSGIMELLLAMGLAGLVSRGARRRWIFGAASLLALAAIVATKTRGGGLVVVIMAIALIAWGPGEHSVLTRWSWRAIGVSLLTLLLMAFIHVDTPFRQRFVDYFGFRQYSLPVREKIHKIVYERLPATSRGRMFGGSWRAWKSAPWTGIGIGMHASHWPRFAATDDGDREAGIWPSMPNEHFHSYETHNDWLQLGSELGIIGVALFMLGMLVTVRTLLTHRRRLCRIQPYEFEPVADSRHVHVLAGLLAIIALGFHSLGDFNLQMPATTWTLAALIAIPIGLCRRQRVERRQ